MNKFTASKSPGEGVYIKYPSMLGFLCHELCHYPARGLGKVATESPSFRVSKASSPTGATWPHKSCLTTCYQNKGRSALRYVPSPSSPNAPSLSMPCKMALQQQRSGVCLPVPPLLLSCSSFCSNPCFGQHKAPSLQSLL